ncbi:MAG: hypothetical protein HY481_00900 [Candidatus Vogelbacteria bacterium]|nr:hypothetical protein [Candidatus Vogelbacteria bacterium]
MFINMLGRLPLSEIQGPRDDFEQKLASEEGEMWLEQFKLFLRKEPCWINDQVTQVAKSKPRSSILEFVSTVVVPATTGKFVAKEKFVRDTGCKAKVKISYLGDNFTEWFLSGDGKTEDPTRLPDGQVTEQTLCYHTLRQSSVDGPIIAELGGAEKAETTLSELFFLMKKQGNGEDDILLSNGWANIFYVRDFNDLLLRAVIVFWNDVGWFVYANSVENPFGWHDGYRVFSRNSG